MSIRFRRHANSWMRPPDPIHGRHSSGDQPSKNTFMVVPLSVQPRLQSSSPVNAAAPLELPPEAVVDVTERIEENE